MTTPFAPVRAPAGPGVELGDTSGALSHVARRAIDAAGLGAIADKVLVGERLSLDEGVQLLESPDVGAVGALANVVRERLHGDWTWFNRNLHINATNVCEATCIFCSFSRLEEGM